MESRERFQDIFLRAHSETHWPMKEKLQITRLRVLIGHMYARWEKLEALRSDCGPGLRSEVLAAELRHIERVYPDVRGQAEALLAECEGRTGDGSGESQDADDPDEFTLQIVEGRLKELENMDVFSAASFDSAEMAFAAACRIRDEGLCAGEKMPENAIKQLQIQLQDMFYEITAVFQMFNSLMERIQFPGIVPQLRSFIEDTAAAFTRMPFAEAVQLLVRALEEQLRDMYAYREAVRTEQRDLGQHRDKLLEKLRKRAAED